MCTYNDVRLHCVLKINNPYTILMNDLKEFPVVLGCRNCTRCSYYKFVTRVSIETNEIESEPNNISYKLAGTRNDDWGGSSMYPERDDGPVRGNIRSSRAISLRFLVSDIKSIEFSPFSPLFLFLFLNPQKQDFFESGSFSSNLSPSIVCSR